MQFLRHLPPPIAWLNPQGRVNRLQYFASSLVLLSVGLAFSWSLHWLFDTGRAISELWIAVIIGVTTPYCFLSFFLLAKRLHDLGLPAIIALPMVLLPALVSFLAVADMINIAPDWFLDMRTVLKELGHDLTVGVGSYLLLAPGQVGENKYGPDPSAEA